jgi:acetyl-CoA synthetase
MHFIHKGVTNMLAVETIARVREEDHARKYDQLVRDFCWDDVTDRFAWDDRGRMNMGYEVIDKHVARGRGDHIALIDVSLDEVRKVTFREMQDRSNQFANMLRQLGVQEGDRVFFYMPRMTAVYVGIVGALKIGAIVGPLFEAFMEDAVYDRLHDAGATIVVTTQALAARIPVHKLPQLRHVVLMDADRPLTNGEVDGAALLDAMPTTCALAWVDGETPMILHYTSGSTGKPKGVMHVHRAMIQHDRTGEWVLDLRPDDVYWCTADPGWVTGTSYGLFAPWLHGVTNVVLRGRFDAARWYETIARFGVTVWYSAPTAFRMLMAAGEQLSHTYDLHRLRHILSVGEPLNPEVIRWGMHAFGQRIHDTWWMTETGAQMICNVPSMDIRLGSMGKPLPGITAAIVDDAGNELPPYTLGHLAIRPGWPSMMRGIWNNKQRYDAYFAISGWYVSGDAAYRDADGYFWFQGRVDDVINTSGERVGPFEVESKLIEHPAVAEAGVIGKPDALRGEMIKAFVSLRAGYEASPTLIAELQHLVKTGLSAHAMPREIEVIGTLPKTRSGKIMRRVLKARELGLPLGDVSTIEE